MTILITVFLAQLTNIVPQADTELSEHNRYQQIRQAVLDYSRVKPARITVDLAGDAGKYYLIMIPTSPVIWVSLVGSMQSSIRLML